MIKYSLKLVVLKHKSNTSGRFAIYLRLTINRKTNYMATGHHVALKAWDAKNEQVKESNPLHDVINKDLIVKKREVMANLLKKQVEGKSASAKETKREVTHNNGSDIFKFVEAYIEEIKNKRAPGTIGNYKNYLTKIEKFHGSRSLTFEEITTDWLNKYELELRKPDGKKKPDSSNYILSQMNIIKSWFALALKRSIISENPFKLYESPAYQSKGKERLTMSEVITLQGLLKTKLNTAEKQALTYFLLGCYTGLRVSDWYKFIPSKHISEKVIIIRAKKNKELVVMPVSPLMKRHIPYLESTRLKSVQTTLLKNLKKVVERAKIDKHITNHCSRHTFAITFCAERGVAPEVCAEWMGINLDTCLENYYKLTALRTYKEADLAWKDL